MTVLARLFRREPAPPDAARALAKLGHRQRRALALANCDAMNRRAGRPVPDWRV